MNMFKPTSAKTLTEYIAMIEEPRHSEIKKLDVLKKLFSKEKKHPLAKSPNIV